jgi:hypothetical protein
MVPNPPRVPCTSDRSVLGHVAGDTLLVMSKGIVRLDVQLLGIGLAFLAVPSPAPACVKLPAKSATKVPISTSSAGTTTQTAVRVCGDTITTARLKGSGKRKRGTRIGAASAAGKRVAWIEERHDGSTRTAIVTLADARRGVLRRFVARRDRTTVNAQLHVLLTVQGDLAWAAGTDLEKGVVAVDQPGKPIRRLDTDAAEGLDLENGRTLIWGSDAIELGFFDLRRKPCPNRGGFKEAKRTDRVIVTYHEYDFSYLDTTATVYRGCDRQTGRDRVLAITQVPPDAGAPDTTFEVGAIEGTLVEFAEGSYSSSTQTYDCTAVDVISGRESDCPDSRA